jgi:K+-transporting ATPase ATPase C chain
MSAAGGSPRDRGDQLLSDGPASLREQLRPLVLSVPLLGILTGVLFPVLLALPARLFCPRQADGSLIVRSGVVVGSRLIGQDNTGPGYLHPRPSAAGNGYDASASSGTNLGPASPKLREDVRRRAEEFRRRNGLRAGTPIPIDAVTCSGSGLDPDISPANAELQVARVARQRQLSEAVVRRLVAESTYGRQLGILGARRVSVLELNLALDRVAGLQSQAPGP